MLVALACTDTAVGGNRDTAIGSEKLSVSWWVVKLNPKLTAAIRHWRSDLISFKASRAAMSQAELLADETSRRSELEAQLKTLRVESEKKCEFVVTTAQDPYPQDIKFELLKEKIELLDAYSVDQRVLVSFNIRGNEWQGRHFVNLQAWRLQSLSSPASAAPDHRETLGHLIPPNNFAKICNLDIDMLVSSSRIFSPHLLPART